MLTLIKRQVVDNAIYFAAAAFLAVTLLLTILTVAFKCDLFDLLNAPFHTVALFIPLPIVVGLGFCALGIAQTYKDRANGVSVFLATLAVTRCQTSLARIISGIIVILTVLIPVAITLIMLCMLRRPLIPPFRALIGEIFVGAFLTALGCYCLGLQTSANAKTLTLALGALPLAAVLFTLILLKGFAWVLVVILLLFVAASLLGRTSSSRNSRIPIITMGFMVLVLSAILLFWGRFLCDLSFISQIPEGKRNIEIAPSGLLAPEIENDPNVAMHSIATVRVSKFGLKEFLLTTDGFSQIWDIFNPFYKNKGKSQTNLYEYDGWSGNWLYFDEVKGLFVCRASMWRLSRQRSTTKGSIELYAGPKGVSRTPDTNLGRFLSPVAQREYSISVAVYDRQLRRFFEIDFGSKTVREGPELKNPESHPIALGPLIESERCSVRWNPPRKRIRYFRQEEEDLPRTRLEPMISQYEYSMREASDYILVLDESGRIDLLHREKLKLDRLAGYLPRPQTLWGCGRSPNHLGGYEIRPFANGRHREYTGIVVGSVSRQGTSMALAVFDRDGNQITTAHTQTDFFKAPWGPALMLAKYLFESLHPPVLTLASYFTAYSFEARSTHRALFLMPNSFVAMARDYDGDIFRTFLLVLLLMLPALLFSGVLGLRVSRDARILGLSRNARRLWVFGTLAFGLAGYITYRLTRPKITLVTCANCGRPRRPDMEKCHRCGSKWHVPELTPPTWRVLDGGQEILPDTPGPAEQPATQ